MTPSKSACCEVCNPGINITCNYLKCDCPCHSPSQKFKGFGDNFPTPEDQDQVSFIPSQTAEKCRCICHAEGMEHIVCGSCLPCSDCKKCQLSDYSKHDHSHCWEEKNPPCGQKIKHFECCLCQEPHPEIQKAKSEGIEQGRREEREKFTRELIDKRKNLVTDTNSQGNCNPRCHDSGKDDIITSLLAFLAQ